MSERDALPPVPETEKEAGPESAPEESAAEAGSASLTDHFRELRVRLIRIGLGIIAGFLICWGFSDFLAEFLYLPLVRVLPAGEAVPSSIIFTGIAEGFFTHMKLAVVAGIFLVSPFIFYQIWAFIAPGLYAEEKKFLVPVAVCSAICFILGGAFCYFVVFPNAFSFFMTYSKGPFKAMPGMDEYFGFTMQLLLAFGLVFEMPVLAFFLSRFGIVSAALMRSFRRYFVVIAFILGAVLTPPDVLSQLLMAGPLLLLYELSILVAALGGKKKTAGEEPRESGPPGDSGEKNAAPPA
jgi:sec-independent protein translocase protein TatC